MARIQFGNFIIYTNEIIHPQEFLKLYNAEESICEFQTKIKTETHHPFATFLAKDRKSTQIKEDDFVILRAIKEDKKFEFITKMRKWGKFDIPKKVIEMLNIQDHENVKFEIIKENNQKSSATRIIDLANIKGHILFRKNDFITICQGGKVPITLPRFIEITSELIELCFLIHGDGSYKEKLFFANKNPELHRFVIDKFEKIFRLPKDIWRGRLLFNNPSDSLVAKENWKDNLDLKEKQFYPSISKSILNTSDNGNLRIGIDKLIVSAVFRYVFSHLQELNSEQAIYAVNGLLYAEGGARKEERGLHKITLSFSQAEKKMFERVLENADILKLTRVEQNSRFCISDWENLYTFFNIFLSKNIVPFKIHTERKSKALSGFLEHKFTQTIEKYLKILNKKDNFNLNELVKETGYRNDSICDTLRKKRYSKFVKFEGKGINKNPFIVSITKEGKEFLMLIKNIREVYDGKCFK